MGLDAQIIAVGPFSPSVLPALEYGPEFYAAVAPSTTVVSNVFLAGTSEASHQLAAAFGVGAMELGRHELQPEHANHELLVKEFGEQSVQQFVLLVRSGFRFYYLPNA
jgi:hypothetical protein